MVNDIAVQEFVKAIKEEPQDTNKTYNATVSKVDGEGVVWVNIHGSDKETPTSSTSTEVKRGDSVTVNWRNNKLYIGGNYSNPSAGIGTVAPSVNYVNDLIDKDISVASINAATGYIGDLTADNITTENIKATNGYIQYLVSDDITAEDISASSGYIKDLQADSITASDISAASGYIKDLESENITAENIIADHETVNTLDANYAHITEGVIDNAKIGHADVNGLNANYAHITSGVIDNAKIGYADVNDLNAHYASINLANVNNAWIQNGVIKNGAIADAQIIGVSANKLTAGTIDASNITVTNLNASNITAGSITVDGITIDVENNEASIDGSYIEDGTITMNGFAQEVKDMIDGAIETYTGTVVPTLNNAPANAWTTAKLKDQHIGDVYYVVNSASQQNGYCYRFTKSNNTYNWQLIKDSDVTAALGRLTTAEGKINNIESFDEEMATFKTETEGEISTLQTKTTNLETSLGDKVEKSVFNEVKQTVDENSASITDLSTITTNNGLTKTTNITNTVNIVSQTAAGNSSKISSLTTTLGTNADGTTKTGDIVHRTSAVEQDLSGFKTTVSETYVHGSDSQSGDIVTWKNMLIKDVVANIEPIQDLHGYDKPWSGGNGKNKANIDDSENGGIDSNGNNVVDANNWRSISLIPIQSGQAYTLHAVGMAITRLYFYDTDGNFISPRVVSQTDTVTATAPSNAKYVKWTIYKTGITIANVQSAKVQLELGSTATSYEPYSNLCPISGRTEVVTSRVGKNRLDYSTFAVGTINDTTGQPQSTSTRLRSDFILLAEGQYTVSSLNGFDVVFDVYDLEKNFIKTESTTTWSATPHTYTILGDRYVRIVFRKPNNSNIELNELTGEQLELGSTATDYEPYNGTQYTTDLGQTVYGGTLDVVSGLLTVDRVMVTFDGTEYWWSASGFVNRFGAFVSANASNENQISNYLTKSDWGATSYTFSVRDKYLYVSLDKNASQITVDEFKAYLSAQPLQVCYELATPQTIQLTPQEVSALVGRNALWTNCDSVRVDLTGVKDFTDDVSELKITADEISTRVGKTEAHLISMYATSSTAEGTAAKVATITPAIPSGTTWELSTGTTITVKFTNANTAASPTLNVNSKGAKAIKTYANGNLTEAEYKWKAGSTFTFTYNGTNWLMQDSTASVRMNSAETGITQNAEQIALRAKSSDVYTKGQVYTKTEADSAITQKANEISLSVAQTEISKIKVGGRNLLTGTAESKELTTAANQNWFSPQPYKLSTYADTAIADTSNTQISISFDYSITGVDTAFNMTASLRTSTATGSYGAGVKVAEIPVGDSSGHAVGTRNITSDMRNNAPGAGIMISGSGNANANAVVTISNVKLEFGNKATDWSPAPEDLEAYTDSQVSAAKAEIKVTTDGISTEVEKKTDKSTIISTIRQSAETVKIKASQVEIDGTATFNAIKSQADAAYDSKGSASAVQTNLDNLEIGGRNLLSNSQTITKTWGKDNATVSDGVATVTCVSSGNARIYQQPNNGYWTWQANQDYTVSVDAKASTSGLKFSFNAVGISKGSSDIALTTDWKRYTWTVSATSVSTETGSISFLAKNGQSGTIQFKNPKLEYGNKATTWTPAPEDVQAEIDAVSDAVDDKADKTAAVTEEQLIYISKASGTTSVSGTTTWITEDEDKQNTWSTKRPTYNSSYPVLFVAKQKKVVSGTVTCTTPIKDDTTTIIDGGHITTGTIDAARIGANSITADKISIGAIEEYENILLDSDAPTLTKVKASYDRYWSDSGNNKIVCSNFTLTDAPEQGLKYGRRFVYDGSVATNNYVRSYAFYDNGTNNSIPLVPNQTYTATWWARCTSGSGRTQFYYSKGDGATGAVSGTIYTLTSYWKKYTHSFTYGSALNTNYNRIWFRALFPKSTAGTVEICGCKLVVGADTESYITRIDSNGIRIHPSSTENNSVVINSDGMEVFKGGTEPTNSVAFYGDYARVGKDGEANTRIAPNEVAISASDNINALRITPDGNTQTVYHSITKEYLIDAGKTYTFTQPSAIPSGTTAQYRLRRKDNASAIFQIKKGTSKSTTSVTAPFPFQYSATTTEVTIKNTGSVAFYLQSIGYYKTEVSPLTEVGGVLALGQYPSIGTHDVLDVGYGSSSSTASCFSVTNYGLVSCRELAIQENNMPISLAITDGTRIDALSADASNNLILGRGWWEKNTSGYNTYVEGYETNLWGRNKIATNMAITQGSDKRLKKDIKDLEDVKDFVMDLKPVEFKYEFASDKARHLGFIAQDVEKSMNTYGLSSDKYGLITEITGTDNIQYKGLNYTEFIPICIKMIQEQQQEIDALKEALNEVLGN